MKKLSTAFAAADVLLVLDGGAIGKTSQKFLRAVGSHHAAVLSVTWLLGLVGIGVVVDFERTVDRTRRAQVVVAQMRNQEGRLLSIAFRPATGPSADPAKSNGTGAEMARAKVVFNNSLAALARLGDSDARSRIEELSRADFALVDRIAALVARGEPVRAALVLGRSERPGGIRSDLAGAFVRADVAYGDDASRSKFIALLGTAGSIVFLLLAFSLTYGHAVRARRRSDVLAMTDELTGIGNRRKLFTDLGAAAGSRDNDQPRALGIFDLDGFKAYNDTFGHPAGDALLARLARRLSEVVGDEGDAYRIGGDEFVVVTAATESEDLLDAARIALTEQGLGFTIGCSSGSTHIRAGITPEQALHVADQRLYEHKWSTRGGHTEAKDALLQVLAEQDGSLVDHLGNVAWLAQSTAVALRLPAEKVHRTRLAAELHDVGKAAIPASILHKPAPLDSSERALIEHHTIIGERILAAAPTLAAIAPIVRSSHERPDGKGYPDRLHLEQIPICSRIIAVVDAYDAMTNDRAYRTAMTTDAAVAELRGHAGTQFDAQVVDAFTDSLAGQQQPPEHEPAADLVDSLQRRLHHRDESAAADPQLTSPAGVEHERDPAAVAASPMGGDGLEPPTSCL